MDEDGGSDIEGGSKSFEQSSMPSWLSSVVHRTVQKNKKKHLKSHITVGKPAKTRSAKSGRKTILINIPGLILLLGTFLIAIVLCIGSQFQHLRRLHETSIDILDEESLSTTMSLLKSWLLGIPHKDYSKPRLLPKLRYKPVIQQQNQRKFGYGLLNRIQEESVFSKTTTTTTTRDNAVRTRTIGAATNSKIHWPILQTDPNQETPRNNDVSQGSSLKMIPKIGITTTATAIRTRTMGAAANSNRVVWPVLNTLESSAAVSSDSLGAMPLPVASTKEKEAEEEEQMEPEPPDSYKIVGFTDYNFREVALKWYHRLEDLGYCEHVLVVYDNAMADYLQSLNDERAYELNRTTTNETISIGGDAAPEETNSISDSDGSGGASATQKYYFYRFEKHLLPPLPKTVLRMQRYRRYSRIREIMLAWRWQYVLGQLQTGTSVLLSDADAIFNLYIDPRDHPDFAAFDVLHSYDGRVYKSIEPPDEPPPNHGLFSQLQEQLGGFTIGSGMNWLKSTPSTIAFVRKLVDTCGAFCDDRTVLNQMMARPRILGIEWDTNAKEIIHGTEAAEGPPTPPNTDAEVKTTATTTTTTTTTASHRSIEEGIEDQRQRLISRTGRSTVTGHRFKIWDREWVFAGDPEHPDECPTDIGGAAAAAVVVVVNWIAMPALDPDAIAKGSSAIPDRKLAALDAWDENCGPSGNPEEEEDRPPVRYAARAPSMRSRITSPPEGTILGGG